MSHYTGFDMLDTANLRDFHLGRSLGVGDPLDIFTKTWIKSEHLQKKNDATIVYMMSLQVLLNSFTVMKRNLFNSHLGQESVQEVPLLS